MAERARQSRRSASWMAAAMLTSLVLAASAAGSEDRRGAAVPEVEWRRLEFQASKLLLVKARAHVVLSQHEAEAARHELLEAAGDEPLLPRGERVLAIELGSRFLGREATTRLLLDPTCDAALQRKQVENGKRQRVKLYRFGRGSIYARRTTPRTHAEQALPPEGWTEVFEETIEHEPGAAVVDPSTLFYTLSVAEPTDYTGGRTLQTFSQGKVQAVEVRMVGEEEIPVDYDLYPPLAPATGDTAEPGPQRIDGRIQALHYELRPENEEDALEFLGLEGDLEIWIDAERRIPVLVSGKVPPMGRVAVKLQRAWLAR